MAKRGTLIGVGLAGIGVGIAGTVALTARRRACSCAEHELDDEAKKALGERRVKLVYEVLSLLGARIAERPEEEHGRYEEYKGRLLQLAGMPPEGLGSYNEWHFQSTIWIASGPLINTWEVAKIFVKHGFELTYPVLIREALPTPEEEEEG